MFGWLSRAANDASLTNISVKSGRWWRLVSIVLITIRFSNPSSPLILARQTSAIPPTASRDSIS